MRNLTELNLSGGSLGGKLSGKHAILIINESASLINRRRDMLSQWLSLDVFVVIVADDNDNDGDGVVIVVVVVPQAKFLLFSET